MFVIVFEGFKNIILGASELNNVLLQDINLGPLGTFNILSIFGIGSLLVILIYQVSRWLLI